jgi:TM2 domain-containing membrane protein YozV
MSRFTAFVVGALLITTQVYGNLLLDAKEYAVVLVMVAIALLWILGFPSNKKRKLYRRTIGASYVGALIGWAMVPWMSGGSGSLAYAAGRACADGVFIGGGVALLTYAIRGKQKTDVQQQTQSQEDEHAEVASA